MSTKYQIGKGKKNLCQPYMTCRGHENVFISITRFLFHGSDWQFFSVTINACMYNRFVKYIGFSLTTKYKTLLWGWLWCWLPCRYTQTRPAVSSASLSFDFSCFYSWRNNWSLFSTIAIISFTIFLCFTDPKSLHWFHSRKFNGSL
jgi:hypothetical protein